MHAVLARALLCTMSCFLVEKHWLKHIAKELLVKERVAQRVHTEQDPCVRVMIC